MFLVDCDDDHDAAAGGDDDDDDHGERRELDLENFTGHRHGAKMLLPFVKNQCFLDLVLAI